VHRCALADGHLGLADRPVADFIRPSSCQTVRKRSQSPASRHSAQFSTSSLITSRSAAAPSISAFASSVG
jgi:hypothetical protein